MTLSHYMLQNLLIITVYLEGAANLDFPILGCAKLKVVWRMYRFVGTERGLWRSTVVEDGCWFLYDDSRQIGE